MTAIHLQRPALTVLAGRRALQRLREQPLRPEDVHVIPGAAVEIVFARVAKQLVVTVTSVESVVALLALEEIVIRISPDRIVMGCTDDPFDIDQNIA